MGDSETMEMHDDEVEMSFGEGEEGVPALVGRAELYRIHKAEREIDRLKGILAAITEAYRQRIDRHEDAIAYHRASLVQMLEHGEKVSFPDLGTAYLTTVRARVEVTDRQMAEKVAEELGCMVAVPDMKALKARVASQVTEGTGEIPPGFEFVPERKTVTVKRR